MSWLKILLIFLFIYVTVLCTPYQPSSKAIQFIETYIQDNKTRINTRYRLHYHLAPPIGWMSDPNGFSYFNGEYHVFYQFHPYEAKWGPMHWGHFSSPDLVHWKYLPTALIPEEEMCYSGSAVVNGNKMILMYTGHKQISNSHHHESQYLAFSDDGVNFHKYKGNPVLSHTPDQIADFRDPKVWKHEDYWYVVIGSKSLNQRGRALLYRSQDLKNWNFLTVLAESNGDSGLVWECPDFFELDGKYVLIVSPLGVDTRGDEHKSTYQSGFIIGDFNYDTFEFKPETSFQEIDYGHDFYAAQTMENDGKRYLIAWFAKWEENYAEKDDGWINAMTIVREVRVSGDNQLLQKPVIALTKLRKDVIFMDKFERQQIINCGGTAEIKVTGDLERKIHLLFEGRHAGGQVKLKWDPETRIVEVDRNGNLRHVKWNPIESHSWKILLDTSSLELFCGEGEVVFSSRVYPNGGWRVTNFSPQTLDMEVYSLSRSVPE